MKNIPKIASNLVKISVILLILILISACSDSSKNKTRLYFPEQTNARHEISNPLFVTFVIENKENQDIDYAYLVVIEFYKNKELISSDVKTDKIHVKKDMEYAVIENFSVIDPRANAARVRVILQETGQSIHYWIDLYDRNTYNKTIYCGMDVTRYEFEKDDWDRNDIVIIEGMTYCDEPPKRTSLP